KPLEIYLLMGQSNMSGRGEVDDCDRVSHPRVFMMDAAGRFVPAVEPVHFDKPSMCGVGPGLAFAKAIAEARPEANVGLVPCAVGGTPLSRWTKHADLYDQALTRAKEARRFGRLAGMLWHQGESDADEQTDAETYGERLAAMISNLRADLGDHDLPCVVGTLGEFLQEHGGYRHFDLVNRQLRTLGRKMNRVRCADADGLGHKGDRLHFDAPAARELGRRYARQMLRLLEE
ncbi:MAG: sialate O-acetylesterase, partial [Phycisphaerae bacterium]